MIKKINSKIVLKALLVLLLGIIAILTVNLFLRQIDKNENIEYAGEVVTNYEELKAIYIDEEKYLPDSNIYTFLLGGVDKFGELEETNSYNNNEQIDFIAVIAYNKDDNTCKILHINRDTMMDVPVLGLGGRSAGTAFEQIALSHTYGTGLRDSAENTVKAVEKLLHGINIDNYAIMKMDAIPILNDKVGGVPVTITENLTEIDESLIAGSTVTLKGDTALQFVRRRMDVSDGTNLSRMNRQEQYILSFYNELKENIQADDSFIVSAFKDINDYVVTDCDFVKLSEFQEMISLYPQANIYSIEGEAVVGEEFMEYYPNKDSLNKLIVELFYKKA